VPICSNNIIETGETCDDGNIISGDGCSSTCQLEAVCGNGKIEANEQCDDSNTANGDGCSFICLCEQPNVTLVKTANISHFSYAGEVVLYTYSITGSFALSNISLVDDRCSPIICAVLDTSHAVCQCVYTVQAGDLGTNVINHANAIARNGLEQCSQTDFGADTETVIYSKICGNGYIDASIEQCDDENTQIGDGCGNTCLCETPTAPYLEIQSLGSKCVSNDVVKIVFVVHAANFSWQNVSNVLVQGANNFTCTPQFPSNMVVTCTALTTNALTVRMVTTSTIDGCGVFLGRASDGINVFTRQCDNGQFCDGFETCFFDTKAGNATCLPGTPPSCDDDVNCTVNVCNATANVCEPLANNALCTCRADICRPKTCQGGSRNSRTCATNSDCPGTQNCTAVPAPAGCYQIYPRDSCVLTQGYWKNHYATDFKPAVPITYDNYICYTPSTNPKNVRDPLYWFNQAVKGSTWIPLAYQYYAAVANLNSYLTNHCCSPRCSAADYFASPDVYACFLFAQQALKTAFTSCTVVGGIPLCCKLAPVFNASISLVHANKCQLLLDRFNNGKAGIVPYCSGAQFSVLAVVSPPPLPPPPPSSSTAAMDQEDEDTEHNNVDAETDTPSAGVQTIYLVVFAAGFVVLLGLTAVLSAAIR